jgi:hypothetical protein
MQRCSRRMLDPGDRKIAGGHGNPFQNEFSLGTAKWINGFNEIDCQATPQRWAAVAETSQLFQEH